MALFALGTYDAPDYLLELKPVWSAVSAHHGFFAALPIGYPGAALLAAVAGVPAALVGLGEAATWRVVSCFGLLVIGLGLVSALGPLLRRATWVQIICLIGLAMLSPQLYWALRIGHPEESLITGMVIGGAVAAAYGRWGIAGVLIGLAAAGKSWPVLIALPLLAVLPTRAAFIKGVFAAGAAFVALLATPALFAASQLNATAHLGNDKIFNVGNFWWFFGTPIDKTVLAQQVVPQPRISPGWVGQISHPLIVIACLVIGAAWVGLRYTGSAAAEESTESQQRAAATGKRWYTGLRPSEPTLDRLSSAFLIAGGLLVLRCVFDSWTVPYYMFPALVLIGLGETMSGRYPLIALVASGLMYKFNVPGDLILRTNPDHYTAVFLGWVIPTMITLIAMGLATARAKPQPEPEPVAPPVLATA